MDASDFLDTRLSSRRLRFSWSGLVECEKKEETSYCMIMNEDNRFDDEHQQKCALSPGFV